MGVQNANSSAEPGAKAAGGAEGEGATAQPAARPARRDKHLEKFSLPEIYSYDFDNNPKPWNDNQKQDMDKYFNYGFTEETWRYHCREMQARKELSLQLSQRADLQNQMTN